MANLKSRYILVIALMASTAIAISALQYDFFKDDRVFLSNLQKFPMEIGGWQGKDHPLEENVYEILETRAIIHRSYKDKNQNSVFLSIVHYHDTKVDFHAPEACLGGKGIKTTKSNKVITLFAEEKQKKLNVAQVITKGTGKQTLTYYFFKAGKFIGANYIKMRLNIAANKLARNDTRGSLIRISTTLFPGNQSKSETQIVGFIEEVYPHLNQSL